MINGIESSSFIIIAFIAFLGAMTPGPNFVIVTKNTLAYSKKTGLYTSLGIFFGVLIHIAYSLIGLDFLTEESVLLYNCIKYCGAAYLIYFGMTSIFGNSSTKITFNVKHEKIDLNSSQGFRSGFITNILNPESSIFYLSVFSQVVEPQTSYIIQICYGLEMALISFLWFVFLTYVLSYQGLRKRLANIQHYIDNGLGLVLIGCGVRLALLY